MQARIKRISPTVAMLYIWTALFVILPLLYVVWLSFMTKAEVWGITNEFTTGNYAQLLQPRYLKAFRDSFKISAISTVLTFLIGYPFAYFTARLDPKYRGIVLLFLMAPFWVNSLVRLYGWMTILRTNGVLNGFLQFLGIVDKPLKMLYTQGAVILGMVYALLPMMILSIYNSVEKMDWSLVEAARDLGAGSVRAFFTVTLPQTLPGVVAGCVLVFVPSMGLFFISDLLGGAKTVLVGNVINTELMEARNWPLGAALSVVLLLLTSALLVVYRRTSKKGSLEDLV